MLGFEPRSFDCRLTATELIFVEYFSRMMHRYFPHDMKKIVSAFFQNFKYETSHWEVLRFSLRATWEVEMRIKFYILNLLQRHLPAPLIFLHSFLFIFLMLLCHSKRVLQIVFILLQTWMFKIFASQQKILFSILIKVSLLNKWLFHKFKFL